MKTDNLLFTMTINYTVYLKIILFNKNYLPKI